MCLLETKVLLRIQYVHDWGRGGCFWYGMGRLRIIGDSGRTWERISRVCDSRVMGLDVDMLFGYRLGQLVFN